MQLSIIDRKVGAISASFGTSMAVESLTHTGDFANEKGAPPITSCGAIYFNLRTLFRNAFNSFGEYKHLVTDELILESIYDDIKNINEAVSTASPNTVCVIYLCTYPADVMKKKYPIAKFKNPNTPNQLFYAGIEEWIYKRAQELFPDIVLFDHELSGEKDTYVNTHIPMDLLSVRNFPSLQLIESHTGHIKSKNQWYTKLYNPQQCIPFNKKTLIIFGDGDMLGPQELKVRRVLIKCAEKNRWTQSTSDERIIMNLRSFNEPHVLDFYRKL